MRNFFFIVFINSNNSTKFRGSGLKIFREIPIKKRHESRRIKFLVKFWQLIIKQNFNRFGKNWQIFSDFLTKNELWERCKGVQCVDLVKSFPTHIFLQNLASIQQRTSPVKFGHSRSGYPVIFCSAFGVMLPLSRRGTKLRHCMLPRVLVHNVLLDARGEGWCCAYASVDRWM